MGLEPEFPLFPELSPFPFPEGGGPPPCPAATVREEGRSRNTELFD